MDDKKDKAQQSFLERFRGKTNVVGKKGINDLIQNSEGTRVEGVQDTPRRKSSLRERVNYEPDKLQPINLDQLLPSTRGHITNRSEGKIRNSYQRPEYVPSFIDAKSSNILPSRLPPLPSQYLPSSTSARRHLSRYNDWAAERTILAGNTKVYEEAFKHLEFLNMVESRMAKPVQR